MHPGSFDLFCLNSQIIELSPLENRARSTFQQPPCSHNWRDCPLFSLLIVSNGNDSNDSVTKALW